VGMIRRNKPKIWFEEKGVILRAVDAAITKRLRERETFIMRYPLASAGNKADRALGFAARASAGAVWLPKTPWAERLLNQLCSFTGEDGRTDDGVDVCSLLARGLDVMTNAFKLQPDTRKPEPKPFTKAWLEQKEDTMDDREIQRYYGR
jgi:predicted phage terminase large subunit-like protein